MKPITRPRRGLHPARRVSTGGVLWCLLATAVLVGLVGMHTVGAMPITAGLSATAVAAPSDHEDSHAHQHRDPGEQQHESDCPGHPGTNHDGPCPDTHGHPGPICQSAALSSGVLLAPALVEILTVPIAGSQQVSPSTVAADAAAGSGCGPPSLTALSISRT